jgi:hypothetical protein
MSRPLRSTLSLLALAVLIGSACGSNPTITIVSPVHGAFTSAPSVTLSGTVTPAGGGREVRVNGTLATYNATAGTWSVTLPLDASAVVNPFLATLTRISDGKLLSRHRIVVHAGESVADGSFSNEGVGLRLNDSGLDQLEPVITSLVDLDLATLLPAGTVVIDNYCYATFIGCLGRVDAIIEGSPPPSIGSFGIDIDSQTNQAFGDINLNNLYVRARVVAVSGIGFTCYVTIQAATTDILGNYTLEPKAGDPSNVDVQQQGPANVVFGGFSDTTDCAGFLGGVVEFFIDLLVGDIQDLMEPAFEDFLNAPDANGNTPVAGAIETALQGIEIAGPIGEGLNVALDAPLFKVAEDNDGITLGSHARVTSDVGSPGCTPPAGTADLQASYHRNEAFPSFGATTPPPAGGVPYDLGITISTSAFNQLLKAQIECGLLRIELTEIDLGGGPLPLNAGFLSILIPELGGLDPATPLRVVLQPTLSPFLTGNAGPGGELGEVRVGHYALELRVDTAANTLLLGGALDFRAGLDMGFAAGQLSFSISEVAPTDITVAILDNALGTNETTLSLTLPFLISSVLPSLGDSLGAFPIPGFFGMALQGVDVRRLDSGFYALFTDLVPAP